MRRMRKLPDMIWLWMRNVREMPMKWKMDMNESELCNVFNDLAMWSENCLGKARTFSSMNSCEREWMEWIRIVGIRMRGWDVETFEDGILQWRNSGWWLWIIHSSRRGVQIDQKHTLIFRLRLKFILAWDIADTFPQTCQLDGIFLSDRESYSDFAISCEWLGKFPWHCRLREPLNTLK